MSLYELYVIYLWIRCCGKKHHDQGNLKKKEFIWVYGSRVLESLTVGREVTAMASGAEAVGSNLTLKHKAGRVHWYVALQAQNQPPLSDLLQESCNS